MTALKSLPPTLPKDKDNTTVQTGTTIDTKKPETPLGNEATGTLTTKPDTNTITVDSITSLDGKATAVVKDGQITIQVINQDTTTPSQTSSTTQGQPSTVVKTTWNIRTSITSGA